MQSKRNVRLQIFAIFKTETHDELFVFQLVANGAIDLEWIFVG